jgi:hypothetical protein
MEAMGGRIVKRYRMYERRLDPAAEPAAPRDRKVYEPPAETAPTAS